jgi:curved DNA-binding protein CbpA
MKDHYRILGVLDDAEDIIIRAAYKALAQRYHPDKWTGDNEQATKKMAEINEAYDVLSDSAKRKRYDEEYFRYRAKNESAEVNDDETSFVSEEDENWQMAIEFFPKIKDEFDELSKYSKILSNTFKVALISNKDFKESAKIKSTLESEYFRRYYGDDLLIQSYAKNLLKIDQVKAAVELNKIIRYMGKSVDAGKIIERILEKFDGINKSEIMGFEFYILELKSNINKREDIIFLLGLLNDEIKNSVKFEHPYYTFKNSNGTFQFFEFHEVKSYLLGKEQVLREKFFKQ